MKNTNSYFTESIAGKRILITGGTTGIGREITLLLSRLGAHCYICGREEQPLNETIELARKESPDGRCGGMIADLSKKEDIKKLFSSLDTEFGAIDILINNAALPFGSVTEGSYDDWQYVVDTNLLAYLAASRYAIDRMKGKGGHIVNIGSMSAEVKDDQSSLYVATKSAIRGFSGSLRKEVNGLGIKVSLIEPGAVDTDMQEAPTTEKKEKVKKMEMLKGEDIAQCVLFCIMQPPRADVVSLQIRPHLQII